MTPTAGMTDADTAAGAEGLVDNLTGFVDDLRRRGIPAGPSELIDAAAALGVLDLLDREALREGLAATLISDPLHRDVFDICFELWFPLGSGARAAQLEVPRDEAGQVDLDAMRALVTEVLADDEAITDGTLDSLAAMIVDELGSYSSVRGDAFSVYQAMSQINPQTLIARIAAAMRGGSGADLADGDDPVARRSARERTRALQSAVETETQRRMAEVRGRETVAGYAVPKLPEHLDFLTAGASEQAKIRRTVDPLARLLAAKLEFRRRRAHHGAVDIRATLRASMSTGGVPIELRRRKPRPGRPELVVICDVSGSVAGFSRFTLQLVYALRQHFSRVRVFAFVDTVAEVTDYFDGGTGDENFGDRMHRMISEADVITRDGHSDYGHMLRGFAENHLDSLTHRGALLILGDARNNYHDPSVSALRRLTERVRHAYWLNPEPGKSWDTGDSVAEEYAAEIDMFECRNADQLARVIADLLPV